MRIFRVFFLLSFFLLKAQDGFEILHHKKSVSIPFRHINNLIFVDLKVNQVNLTFLLDTGVAETLLFSLDNKDITFENAEKIRFTGLGGSQYIEGIKSTQNQVQAHENLIDSQHEIYLILDEEFNFSSHVGIPVNGIMGYHFFKNHRVKIDFNRKRITVYRDGKASEKKFRKFERLPMVLEGNKPYIEAQVQQNRDFFPAKMLVDLGNSDALWLFPNRIPEFNYNRPNIDDFLGRGFNGDIYGKRSRIHAIKIGSTLLDRPIVALPSAASVQSMSFAKDRIGSIGADILKRFVLGLDYPNGGFYFKKTASVGLPFKLNMSGLDVKHDGMRWEKDLVRVEVPKMSESNFEKGTTIKVNPGEFQYKFVLKPEYSVAGVREGSPAFEAGIKKGDQLLEINNKKVSEMSLEQINNLFSSEENRLLKIKLLRKSETLVKEILLKDPIPYQEN